MAAVAARRALPHPVDDRVVAAFDPVPAAVAVHRVVAPADRSRSARPGAPRRGELRGRRRTRAPTAAACRVRRAGRGRGPTGRRVARPARRGRRGGGRWRGRRPARSRLIRWSRPSGRAARSQASSSAGRSKNEPSAMAASIRGRSWRTGRPAPRLRCPTSELPIWPGGSPTASSEARSVACGQSRQSAAPDRHPRGRDRVGRGIVPDPEPVEDDEDDRSRPAATRRADRLVGWSGRGRRHAAPRAAAVSPARATIPAISSGLSEAPPTSAPSIDGLGEELGDVGRGDAAAVEDRDVAGRRAPAEPGQAVADGPRHRRRVVPARVAAGPDRPDRLVGDDQPAGREGGGVVPRQRARQLSVDDRVLAARPRVPRAAPRRTGSAAGRHRPPARACGR